MRLVSFVLSWSLPPPLLSLEGPGWGASGKCRTLCISSWRGMFTTMGCLPWPLLLVALNIGIQVGMRMGGS